jgi:hypothetical protein
MNTLADPLAKPSPRDLALQRLADTRAQLKREMQGPGPLGRMEKAGVRLAGRWRAQWLTRLAGLWRYGRQRARHTPTLVLALGAVEHWWHQHPWRAPCEMALSELETQLKPLVRRHPLATLVLSAAVGASLVAGRPWRWPWVSQQLQPLPRRAVGWVVAELRRLPLQALVTSALLAMGPRETNTGSADADTDTNTDGADTHPPEAGRAGP